MAFGAGAFAGRRLAGLSGGLFGLGGQLRRVLQEPDDSGGFCELSFRLSDVNPRYTFFCRVDECQFRRGSSFVLCAESSCQCSNSEGNTPCEEDPAVASYTAILNGVNGPVQMDCPESN